MGAKAYGVWYRAATMPMRLVASVLAMALLVTSAVTHGASYLCRAQGTTHTTRCCTQAKSGEAPHAKLQHAKLQSASDCCELRASPREQAPAASCEAVRLPSASAVLVARAFEPLRNLPRPLASLDVQPARSICGPPRTGPPVPLFIRHCRYLI